MGSAYARAYGRALGRLRDAHPREFAQALLEELPEAEAEEEQLRAGVAALEEEARRG